MKIKTNWKWLEDNGYPSVTDFCRYAVGSGVYPLNTSVEVYRGEMLCLTVSSLEYGAKYMPTGIGFEKYDKTKRRRLPQAPLVRLNELEVSD